MSRRLPMQSRYRLMHQCQRGVAKRLADQFPDLPWQIIYERVSEARVPAARRLPDLTAYADALEEHARALVIAAAPAHSLATPIAGEGR
jgi:hypothetical protein